MVKIKDIIAAVSTDFFKRDVRFRIVARPVAQILDQWGRVIIESQNEKEIRELYRLIKGRNQP
jgi:hypothetical protein